MNKLPKVGYMRMSKNLKTLVVSMDGKVYLMFTEDVLDLINGYRGSVDVVEGRVYEEIKTFP